MTGVAPPSIFRVIIPGDQEVGDPLGLWQVVVTGTAFDLQQPEGVVWRADLPSDPLEAANALRSHSLMQRVARQALEAAPQRLSLDLGGSRKDSDAPAFGQQMAEPGRAMSVLQLAQHHALEQLPYSAQDDLGIIAVANVFRQFIEQVQRMVGQFAFVESAISGRISGVTRVAWSGSIHTWWGSHAGELEVSQHNHLLVSALTSRQDWMRFLTLLTSLVVRISVAFAIGPFSLLAIWTAWNYVQEILKEYSRLRRPSVQSIM